MADDLSQELRRNIPLSEMIQTLRHELTVALQAGKDSRMRLLPKKVDLELQIVVEREGGVGGKVSIGVVQAEGQLGKKQQDTHLFRLELEPRWLTDDGELVSIPIADTGRLKPQQG